MRGHRSHARGGIVAAVLTLLFAAGCGTSPASAPVDGGHPDGAVAGMDAGHSAAADGGDDAGTLADGGGTADAGTGRDGGPAPDGGAVDGGLAGDGGPAPDGGASAAAHCATGSMIDLYPGALPTNPYGDSPDAQGCFLAPHDVIVVLGCPSAADGGPAPCQIKRADIAAALWNASLADRFIVSGAAVHNEYVEADALAALLEARGVPAALITREPRAEHTDENIYYSTRIMEERGWQAALVVSDDPGHLIMSAVCDSNCCVKLGRLTVLEYTLDDGAGGSATWKVGHYVRYPWATEVSTAECDHVGSPLKLMCINLSSRRACAGNLQLPP